MIAHLCTILLLTLHTPARAEHDSLTFYVSPSGSDTRTGTEPVPSAASAHGPFATLARARDAVRRAIGAGKHPAVIIRAGTYIFTSTLAFGPEDSGTPGHDVVWRTFPGETVRFVGGKVIGSFAPVTDPAIRERLPLAARNAVRVTDLHSQGITDPGTPPNRLNVFFRGSRMPVARYPNTGWLKIAAVPLLDTLILNQGDKKVIKDGSPAGRHSGMFCYDGDRPSHWADQSDIWMHGYWVWDWRDAYQKVRWIDTTNRTIHPDPPHHHYGYQRGQRYRFLNVLEELDEPGEWYLDARRGLLYFWPPAGPASGDVTVSLLREPMVELHDVAHMRVENIVFESSRACAVRVRGGTGNLIAGCTIRSIDNDTSAIIDGGTNNGIRSCDIHDVGSTGIKIAGGDRTSLTPAGNFAINNHITRYGQILQSFNGGIFLEGVGNVVAQNRIHDAPFSGIQYYGNDHRIEFNEVYDLAHESGDVGGINTGGDYSDMGTIIRYNHIHDTHGRGEGGFRAIYLDLPGSNTTIYGNVIANVDIGVFFNSGRDNRVENNIFYRCHPAVNIYIWPHRQYFAPGGPWRIYEKLQAVRFTEPPYSARYPGLPHYLDPADLGMPYGHRVRSNLSAGGTWLDLSEEIDPHRISVENNVVGDSMLLVLTKKWTQDYDPYAIGYVSTHARLDTATMRAMSAQGNVIADPAFLAPERGNFRLSPDSPAWRVGFQPIPFDSIGIVADAYRRSVPPR